MFNIFDELAAEEYRKDRMRDAEEHNLGAQFKQKRLTLRINYTLGKMGALLENWGAKIKTYYNYPEPCEKHEMLVKPTK